MLTQVGSARAANLLPAIALFSVLCLSSTTADAQRAQRQGKEVVDVACAACHVPGKDGAPRIGDTAAWAARASQGLTALSKHAITGIRKMPAHGGSPGVSDTEIQRAIVYMVNQSGGNWVEPLSASTPAASRTSEAVVQTQCARCHEPGKDGAPKVGDRTAWTPRMGKGLEQLVASAVHGHGGMPARGGMADLSRDELRGAILYMFNYGLPAVPTPPPVAAADPHHKVVEGMDVYLGMMRADAMRSQVKGVPSGKDYYHLNISLADNKTQVPIGDARVTMRISDGMSTQTRTLNLLAANNAVSWGNYFRLDKGNVYSIRTEIKRPGAAETAVANFEYRAP